MKLFDKYLRPDFIFDTYREVTPQFCAVNNIKAIVSDIDNTLVTYDDPEPTEEVAAWYHALTEAGVKIAFASNNDWERVTLFNRSLGAPAIAKSGKPLTGGVLKMIAEMGSEKETTVLLGDQLLTDVAAANRAGIRSIVVPPIKDKRSLFFRAKRAIERPYMKRYLTELNSEK